MGCNLSLPGRSQSGGRFNHFSPLVNGDEEDEVRAEQSLFSEWTGVLDNGGDGGDGGGLVRRTWKKIMFLVFCRRVFSLACCCCCCCSEEQCVCYTRHDTKQARVRYCSGSGSGSVTVAVWLVLGKRSSTCRSALISFTFTSFLKIQQSKGNRDTKLRSRTNHISSFSKPMRSS